MVTIISQGQRFFRLLISLRLSNSLCLPLSGRIPFLPWCLCFPLCIIVKFDLFLYILIIRICFLSIVLTEPNKQIQYHQIPLKCAKPAKQPSLFNSAYVLLSSLKSFDPGQIHPLLIMPVRSMKLKTQNKPNDAVSPTKQLFSHRLHLIWPLLPQMLRCQAVKKVWLNILPNQFE